MLFRLMKLLSACRFSLILTIPIDFILILCEFLHSGVIPDGV